MECFDFIIDLYFGEKALLLNAGKILFKEGGFIQISVGIENDCISDGTYIMFTSNDTIYKLRKDTRITAKEAIFKETFDWQKEVCLLIDDSN